ncbi:MAG: DNA mismatch repair endonuclease MutL [Candidatus Omnitrophica bacterium]|nr:DNA mismatch repair endonuclease MutL [Candidatus Omnitrophota bacterium]
MSKVRVLSEDIVAKIAAGEVIDRPASVVKELMENSIDAGATHIHLELKEAGKSLISIRDNGSGIDHDDLETIFERHATSKITTLDDLFDIHSLGFRGEALYSVAAIADITLRSRTADSAEGWEIHMRGGAKQDIKPCPFNDTGTHIEIRELFFNTPARKKFLKTTASEFYQVMQIFTPYTLLHPRVGFKLTHQGRDIIDVAATDDLPARIAEVLNLKADHMLSVTRAFPDEHLVLKMVLGDINIQRTRRDLQFVFVNNRPVFNKNINYHLNQVFRLIMPPEAFPFFVLYIEVPATDVDVNIHPTKREVKLRHEREICSLLRRVTEETLMNSPGREVSADSDEPKAFSPVERSFRYEGAASHFDQSGPQSLFDGGGSGGGSTGSGGSGGGLSYAPSNKDYAYPRAEQTPSFYLPKNELAAADDIQTKLENARYIGAFIRKFLIYEAGRTMLLMDQHAAAERITYEKLIRHMEKGDVEIQPLLAPVLVSVTPQEKLVYDEIGDELLKVGFEHSLFDDQTIAVHSQPLLLKDVEATVRYILAGDQVTNRDHDQIARRACRSSIMTGDKLGTEEAEYLREQLLQCLDPFTCPHGRPTVIELSENFLDQQFMRIK